MDNAVTTTITLRKKRVAAEDRMTFKALLLENFPGVLNAGGQLIIHFGPGRTPLFVEVQEREDHLPQQLRRTGT